MILFETTHFVNYHCQLEAFYGLEYGLVRIFSMHWHSAFNSLELTLLMGLQYRWTRSLDPAINKEDWSEQEELKLIRAHQIYGSQWLKMVKHFPGRYDWMIFTVKK